MKIHIPTATLRSHSYHVSSTRFRPRPLADVVEYHLVKSQQPYGRAFMPAPPVLRDGGIKAFPSVLDAAWLQYVSGQATNRIMLDDGLHTLMDKTAAGFANRVSEWIEYNGAPRIL